MTHTFTEKDGLFTFTVKKEFLDKCPNPNEHDLESLTTNYEFNKFLHNPMGPAVIYEVKIPQEVRDALLKNEAIGLVEDKVVAYWLNGNLMSGEELKKLKHDTEFGDKFDKMLAQ